MKISFWSNLRDIRVAKSFEVLNELERLAVSLPPKEFPQAVVDLLSKDFELPFVGFYLVDTVKESAIFWVGTGDAGKEIARHGHKLPLMRPTPVCEAIRRNAVCVWGSCPISGIFYSLLDLYPEKLPPFQFIETTVASPLLDNINTILTMPLRKAGTSYGAIEIGRMFGWDREDILWLIPVVEKIALLLENPNG